MRFVTFQHNGSAKPGVLREQKIISLTGAGFSDLLSVIAGGAEARRKVEEWLPGAPAGEQFDLASVKLRAPLPRPPKIICVGLNYRDHAVESKMEIPGVPTIFSKYPTAVIGPGDNIVLPRNS